MSSQRGCQEGIAEGRSEARFLDDRGKLFRGVAKRVAEGRSEARFIDDRGSCLGGCRWGQE